MLDLVAAVRPLGQPFTTAAAASAGLTADIVARGVRRGLLVRLTRGSYVLADVWFLPDAVAVADAAVRDDLTTVPSCADCGTSSAAGPGSWAPTTAYR